MHLETFYSNDFTGFEPTGTAIICKARNKKEASQIFQDALEDIGLEFDGTVNSFNEYDGQVLILSDGDY